MAVNVPGAGTSTNAGREPLGWAQAITETLRTVVPVLVLFKLINWTPEQIAGAIIAIGSILGLIQLIYTRARVTPVNSPVLPAGTVVSVTAANGQPASTAVVGEEEGPA